MSCDGETVEEEKNRVTLKPAKPAGYAHKFKDSWTKSWPWLKYNAATEKCYCSLCQEAHSRKLLNMATSVKDTFISGGFHNWKKGPERFRMHEKSDCHCTAVMKLALVMAGVNVGNVMSKGNQKDHIDARTSLHRICTSLQFLAAQGLAIRGKHDEKSNIFRLLQLRGGDNKELKSWMARSKYKWVSHDIQNELLHIMSDAVLSILCDEIRAAQYFAVMVDETSDIAVKEQMVVCFRYCDSQLDVHEIFTGFHEIEKQDAATLFSVVKDVMIRFNFDYGNCRGQCYDGAANVSGHLNGLQAKMQGLDPRAIFVHCASHALNLVTQDAVSKIAVFRDALSMLRSLIAFVRDSPKRLGEFKKLQSNDSNSLRPFCPTRWVLRENAVASVMSNYGEMMQFLDGVSNSDRADPGAKAGGFLRDLSEFKTMFALSAIQQLFGAIGTANTATQSSSLHLQESANLIQHFLLTLKSYRQQFDIFWHKTTDSTEKLNIEEAEIPRQRKKPSRFAEGGAEPTVFETAKDYFRPIYFSLIDSAVGAITDRITGPTWDFLTQAEMVMLNKKPSQLLSDFYGSDVDATRLSLHISMFHDLLTEKGQSVGSLADVISILKGDATIRKLLPEFVKAIRLLLTIPVTTCSAERSFWSLRRLKTYLRSTMTQVRLNNVSILHCHSEAVRGLDMDSIMDEFICRATVRGNTFALKK